jgi:hypothetical protein
MAEAMTTTPRRHGLGSRSLTDWPHIRDSVFLFPRLLFDTGIKFLHLFGIRRKPGILFAEAGLQQFMELGGIGVLRNFCLKLESTEKSWDRLLCRACNVLSQCSVSEPLPIEQVSGVDVVPISNLLFIILLFILLFNILLFIILLFIILLFIILLFVILLFIILLFIILLFIIYYFIIYYFIIYYFIYYFIIYFIIYYFIIYYFIIFIYYLLLIYSL